MSLLPQSPAARPRFGGVLLSISLLMATAACAGPGSESMSKSPFTGTAAAALADAVRSDDAALIKTLVASGGNPNAEGEKGMTLLQWAMFTQNRTAFLTLLGAGADPTRGNQDGLTAIHLAAMADTDWWLEKLLERKFGPDTPNTVTAATPLMAALLAERSKNVDVLLAAGADPNAKDRKAETALHLAASINESARVLSLLESGADPLAKNAQGVTFQRYLFMTPERTLSATNRAARERVRAWLVEHRIAVEDPGAR
jgi:uncharacterized protein